MSDTKKQPSASDMSAIRENMSTSQASSQSSSSYTITTALQSSSQTAPILKLTNDVLDIIYDNLSVSSLLTFGSSSKACRESVSVWKERFIQDICPESNLQKLIDVAHESYPQAYEKHKKIIASLQSYSVRSTDGLFSKIQQHQHYYFRNIVNNTEFTHFVSDATDIYTFFSCNPVLNSLLHDFPDLANQITEYIINSDLDFARIIPNVNALNDIENYSNYYSNIPKLITYADQMMKRLVTNDIDFARVINNHHALEHIIYSLPRYSNQFIDRVLQNDADFNRIISDETVLYRFLSRICTRYGHDSRVVKDQQDVEFAIRVRYRFLEKFRELHNTTATAIICYNPCMQ